jgi:hypothetical protein
MIYLVNLFIGLATSVSLTLVLWKETGWSVKICYFLKTCLFPNHETAYCRARENVFQRWILSFVCPGFNTYRRCDFSDSSWLSAPWLAVVAGLMINGNNQCEKDWFNGIVCLEQWFDVR